MVRSARAVKFRGKAPVGGGFVAPSATIVGDVKIGKDTSFWYGSVVRGKQHIYIYIYPS